ncbi:MAG: aminoacyl-tRNA hydrolase [Candidatus Aminicenantes bacterium]|nr:aminoacyl-tRNA hydrolase [Candidatus Aminicenantes bacterium]
MWLVVGLGNPGEAYARSRHNAGFMLIERLARAWDAGFREKKGRLRVAEARCGGEPVLLAQPLTYMNLSGQAVRALVASRRVAPERLLVAYDDLDIPLGEIRVRPQGSAGTHKGMQSIVRELGTTKFPRLRIGIGPLPEGRDAAAYVLRRFRREEREVLERGLTRAAEAVDMILAGGLEKAMTAFNRKTPAG